MYFPPPPPLLFVGSGYSCAVELLRAMPAAARLQYSQKHSDFLIYPVADSNTYLPSWHKKFEGLELKLIPLVSRCNIVVDKHLSRMSAPPPSSSPRIAVVANQSPRRQTTGSPPRSSSGHCPKTRRERNGSGRRGGEGGEKNKMFTVHVGFRHSPHGAVDDTESTSSMMVAPSNNNNFLKFISPHSAKKIARGFKKFRESNQYIHQ